MKTRVRQDVAVLSYLNFKKKKTKQPIFLQNLFVCLKCEFQSFHLRASLASIQNLNWTPTSTFE